MAAKRAPPKPSAQSPSSSSSDEESEQEAAPSPVKGSSGKDQAREDEQQGEGASSGDEETEDEEQGSGSSSSDDSDSEPKPSDPPVKAINPQKPSPPTVAAPQTNATEKKPRNGGGTKRKLFEKLSGEDHPTPSRPRKMGSTETLALTKVSKKVAGGNGDDDNGDNFKFLMGEINRSDNKSVKDYVAEKGFCFVDRSKAKKLDRDFRELGLMDMMFDLQLTGLTKEALNLLLDVL